jgi:hypothetical protein
MLYYFRLWRRRYSRPFNRIFYILIFLIFIGFILSISSVLLLDGDDYDDGIVVKKSPLIFCFVLSSNDRHLTSSRAIIYTWGKRCDRFYFVTRLQNTSVELMMLEKFENITNITSNTITQHTLNVLSYLEKEALFSSYHWFLRGSDDSFVILPNLRRLINQLNPNYPLAYVGDVEQMYKNYQISTSGSVMLFNRHALTRLTSFDDIKDDKLYNEKEECLENIIYDHELVKCMKQIGININPLNNNLILSQNLSTYRMDKRLKGNCCSPYTVAFRSNNETDMYKFDFFYHRLDALSKINI